MSPSSSSLRSAEIRLHSFGIQIKHVGEFAIAIGAPFELEYSKTYGHISAKGRSAVTLPATWITISSKPRLTSTQVVCGPSSTSGEVIGVNTTSRPQHRHWFAPHQHGHGNRQSAYRNRNSCSSAWNRHSELKRNYLLNQMLESASQGVVVSSIQAGSVVQTPASTRRHHHCRCWASGGHLSTKTKCTQTIGQPVILDVYAIKNGYKLRSAQRVVPRSRHHHCQRNSSRRPSTVGSSQKSRRNRCQAAMFHVEGLRSGNGRWQPSRTHGR